MGNEFQLFEPVFLLLLFPNGGRMEECRRMLLLPSLTEEEFRKNAKPDFKSFNFLSHKIEINQTKNEIHQPTTTTTTTTTTMSPFSALSEMATRSTIYKRHENRNNSYNGGDHYSVQPPSHQAIDNSVAETLMNLSRRSTIYHTHDVHHQEMRHNPHAGERFMAPSMINHHDSVVEAIVNMPNESSIYDRNFRRNQYLHYSIRHYE